MIFNDEAWDIQFVVKQIWLSHDEFSMYLSPKGHHERLFISWSPLLQAL